MSEFKVGDKVERMETHNLGVAPGERGVIIKKDYYANFYQVDFNGKVGSHDPRYLRLLEDELSVGDVLEADDASYTKEVLHVLPDGIVVTQDSDDLEVHAHTNEAELLGDGWKKKTAAKEYTLKEIADKLNIDVTDLRIKE